jgi:hypothetical protein
MGDFPTHHGQIELLLGLLDVIAEGALNVMLAQLILQHPFASIGIDCHSGARLPSSAGSLAILAAIRRASSRVISFAADRGPRSSSK